MGPEAKAPQLPEIGTNKLVNGLRKKAHKIAKWIEEDTPQAREKARKAYGQLQQLTNELGRRI